MGRRRLVVLLSAITMMLIGAGIVGALVAATQSDGGREWIRAQLGARGRARREGHGCTSEGCRDRSSPTSRVDSLAIIGPDDSVFIATGPVHVTYDPRDLLDGRIIARSVELQHPFFVIRKEVDSELELRPGLSAEPAATPGPPPSRSAFGAIVQFRNVRMRGLHFQLTLPWAPDDSLKGARRDSAIVRNLAATDQEIRARRRQGKARLPAHARAGPKATSRSTASGCAIPARRASSSTSRASTSTSTRPPFAVRNMRGGVLWHGDSLVIDIRHLELPGSVARGFGTHRLGRQTPDATSTCAS